MIWIETPTNPTIKLVDIAAVSEAVKKDRPDIKIIADNTFATSYLQSPLLLGADVAYHSITKYIGGHSDFVMGALVFKDDEYRKRVHFVAYTLGACPSPFDCFLALRGLKTLELRVYQSTRSAYHIAHFLNTHKFVDSVIYPGLKDNKQH